MTVILPVAWESTALLSLLEGTAVLNVTLEGGRRGPCTSPFQVIEFHSARSLKGTEALEPATSSLYIAHLQSMEKPDTASGTGCG